MTPIPSPEPAVDDGPSLGDGVQAATDYAALSLRIALIILGAIVLRFVVHRALSKVVGRAAATPAVPESLRARFGEPTNIALERRKQRTETVGTVLRSVATILIFGVAFTTVLSELGVDLGPILASAGILGVAVGFGAQNLVRDFLNGIFMILEDQYGVGDAVDLGEAVGIIESVGLRTTRLRSVDGTVWHVRNGEILRVGNQSQGWSRALLDVSVAYDTDIDHAQEVIMRVATEVAQDEELGPLVLDDPEVWGVETLGVDGIAIRLVVKTAPLEQWKVARELRRRLKDAFAVEGIEIPFPQRSLWLRTSPDGTPSPVTEPGAAQAKPASRKASARKGPARSAPASSSAPADGDGGDGDDGATTRRAIRRPVVSTRSGEADAARADTGALRLPGMPVSATGPVDDAAAAADEPRP